MTGPFDEDVTLSQDDEPEKVIARAKLICTQLMPVAGALVATSQTLEPPKSDSLKCVLWKYKHWRDTAERGMTGAGVGGKTGHQVQIDRHKVAAAFLLAIIDAHPITAKPGMPRTTKLDVVANFTLAFRTAINVLRVFGSHKAKIDADPVMQSVWGVKMGFIYPPTRDGRDYREHATLALYHAHQNNRALNLPVISNWLFTLEQYHVNAAKALTGLSASGTTVPLTP